MTGTDGRRWAATWIAPALVAAVTVAVFARSVTGGFVSDDKRFITDNVSVTAPSSWLAFLTDARTVDETGAGGIVRPLRTLEYAIDYAGFGANPVAFHVHSLLWHVAAAVLLLFVARRILGDALPALAATLFWAVHPVQTESAAFISSRGDVAMGACCLASVLFALRSRGWDGNFALSLAAAAVAPLYKETAVALWLGILLLRWTRRTRVPVWPYLGIAVLYVIYRRAAQHAIADHPLPYVLGGSLGGTFATMFRAFGFYVAETLLPAQSFDWYMTPSRTLADSAALVWLAVHATLLVSAFRARHRAPVWTVAVGWFYAFLLPVSNWPFFLGIPTTERFLYVPLAGVALAAGFACVRVPRCVPALFVAVAALGVSSVARSAMWQDQETLWSAIHADHVSARYEMYRGLEARTRALALRDAALALPEGPARTEALDRVRLVLEESLGHYHNAIALWHAFELEGPYSQLTENAEVAAANVCYIAGRSPEALFHADQAIRIDEAIRKDDPPSWRAHYNRALALSSMGFAPQAIASMRRALEGVKLPDAEIGDFFVRAAAACREAHLAATEETALDSAVRALPPGRSRDAAATRLAELRQRPRSAESESQERAALAEFDAALAQVPVSCPVAK
jgi:tetratricopeptide (TPR) repeat protein